MAGQRNSLKQAVTQILSCALQPDSEIQRLTEERKKALEMTEDYPFILFDIIQGDEALSERTMAAAFLKNYVLGIQKCERERVGLKADWEVSLSLKALNLLGCRDHTIRHLICQTLCILMHEFNYDNYELISVLNNKIMSYLLSDDMSQISGAIKLMKELFFYHRLYPKFPYFSPEHIEPLLTIIQNESYPVSVRGDTVVCMIEAWMSCQDDRDTFTNIHSRLTECFVSLLKKEYDPDVNNFQFKGDLIFGLMIAILQPDDHSVDLVKRCLTPVGEIFFGSCQIVKNIVMGKPMPKDSHEDDEMYFSKLILYVLQLIENVLQIESLIPCFESCLDEFVYNLFNLMCVWDEEYVDEHVDDDASPMENRIEACNVLLMFKKKMSESVFNDLINVAIQKHLTEANELRQSNEVYFVRVLEALMYALGTLHSGAPIPAFVGYVDEWSIMLRNCNDLNWFIIGRLIWLGSRCTTKLSRTSLELHLSAILACRQRGTAAHHLICLSALNLHLENLPNNPNKEVVYNFAPDISCFLLEIGSGSANLAVKSLELMKNFFQNVAQSRTDSNSRSAFTQISYLLQMYLTDVTVVRSIEIALSALTRYCNKQIVLSFVSHVFVLVNKSLSHFHNRTDVVEIGLRLLNSVIMFWNGEPVDNLVLSCVEAAYNNIIACEDVSNMSAGITLLTNMIMKIPNKMKTLSHKGKTLLEVVNDVVYRLLDSPYGQEHCPRNFGRFIVVSVICFPDHFNGQMDTILKGLITFLQRRTQPGTLTDCYLIFSYFFTWQTENLLDFLSNIPGPDGRSALAFFLNNWTTQYLPQHPFEMRIMSMGLCKMIEFCLTKPDFRINDCECVMEESYYGNSMCSGLDKLYLLLLKIFLTDILSREDPEHNIEEHYFDDELLKTHPLYNMNLTEHIKTFIKNFCNYHYYRAYERIVKDYDNSEVVLSKNGLVPVFEGMQLRLSFNANCDN